MWSDYPHSSTLDYVIRYETLNPPCITHLPSNTKLWPRASMILLLQLSHLSYSLFVFDLVFELKRLNHWSNHSKNRFLLLKTQIEERSDWDYLLSSYWVKIFICLERYKRNIWKNRQNNKPSHKLINTTIVLVVIENPIPPWFSWLFPMVFLGLFCLYWVTRLSTTDPIVISSVFWLTSATQDLFFLSSLRSLGCCFYSSLRFFITLFLSSSFISNCSKSILIDFLFLVISD